MYNIVLAIIIIMYTAGFRAKALLLAWVSFAAWYYNYTLHQCRTVPRVLMPCSWNELSTYIPSLHISAPDGLFSGNECLTFVTNGTYILLYLYDVKIACSCMHVIVCMRNNER